MLIGLVSGVTPEVLAEFLGIVFKSMVLCLGIDELTTIKNSERLKRELRVTYRLIDKLLEGLEPDDKVKTSKNGNTARSASGDIHSFVEVILCQVKKLK